MAFMIGPTDIGYPMRHLLQQPLVVKGEMVQGGIGVRLKSSNTQFVGGYQGMQHLLMGYAGVGWPP
jgi:hypothetical protein